MRTVGDLRSDESDAKRSNTVLTRPLDFDKEDDDLQQAENVLNAEDEIERQKGRELLKQLKEEQLNNESQSSTSAPDNIPIDHTHDETMLNTPQRKDPPMTPVVQHRSYPEYGAQQ